MKQWCWLLPTTTPHTNSNTQTTVQLSFKKWWKQCKTVQTNTLTTLNHVVIVVKRIRPGSFSFLSSSKCASIKGFHCARPCVRGTLFRNRHWQFAANNSGLYLSANAKRSESKLRTGLSIVQNLSTTQATWNACKFGKQIAHSLPALKPQRYPHCSEIICFV